MFIMNRGESMNIMNIIVLFILLGIIFGFIFVGITCLLGLIRGNRVIKYIPTGIALIATIISLLMALFIMGFAYVLLGVISLGIFVFSLITALIMEFVIKKKSV